MKCYADKKAPEQAVPFLNGLADTDQYPFTAAADLLTALGRDRSADQMTIFTQALGNFQQHPNAGYLGQDDIGTFIERAWQQVPPGMALDAIDKVLDQAK